MSVYGAQTLSQHILELLTFSKYFLKISKYCHIDAYFILFFSLQKNMKKTMIMKILPHVQNCNASTKMPKNRKNDSGNIFKLFFEIWQILISFKIFFENHQFSPTFKKYFENVLNIIFSFFWHFCTRTTILYEW